MHEAQLYPKKLTVWCGFHAGGVICPFFYFDENDAPTIVNGDRYRAMISEYFWDQLDAMNLDDILYGSIRTAQRAIQRMTQSNY